MRRLKLLLFDGIAPFCFLPFPFGLSTEYRKNLSEKWRSRSNFMENT